MKYFNVVFLFVFATTSLSAQVPKLGNDTLLDIACWNIEWFGDVANGPSNETLQFNNVKSVLLTTDIDVWALEEVSDATAWANLTAALPAYGNAITTYAQTQKTALIWKNTMFDLISSQNVLTDAAYTYDFASGRPPFEVVLQTKNTSTVDTLYFYVLHLKAYGDSDSYTRRKKAAGYLKTFLETERAGKKVIVLGDWNDDLNVSTYNNSASPFADLVSDTARYYFPTKSLCDQGKSSYITGGKMLDEQMLTPPFKKLYVNGSCRVVDELPNYISGYLSDNTSDHYPVLGFYNLKRYAAAGLNEIYGVSDQIRCSPNPSVGVFFIETKADAREILITNQLGQIVNMEWKQVSEHSLEVKFDERQSNGIYFLRMKSGEGAFQSKVILQR